MRGDLRVHTGVEAMALGPEGGSELGEILELAVLGHPHPVPVSFERGWRPPSTFWMVRRRAPEVERRPETKNSSSGP